MSAASTTPVTRVGQEALEPVAVTVAASFADDPIWKWIYEVDDTLPFDTGIVLARMLVAGMAPADEVHTIAPRDTQGYDTQGYDTQGYDTQGYDTQGYDTQGYGAVALWTAPAGSTLEQGEAAREAQTEPHFAAFAAQLGDRVAITGELSAAMRSHRPEEPHWYLGILGTHPDSQNQGLGSAVLQTMLAKADHLGVPTFLESSNPRNYGFYQRHGYTEQAELTVQDSPPLLGFWRPAR